jgi:hypothetical protein
MAIQANRQARETIDDRSTHYKPGQGMRNRSLGVAAAIPCQLLRLSGDRCCFTELTLDVKPFGQHRDNVTQIFHAESDSAEDLRSSPLMLSVKDAEIDNASGPINAHDNFSFAFR